MACWAILARVAAGQDATQASAASGRELRAALEDPNVLTIQLTGDVALSAHSGWTRDAPLVLDRSVALEAAGEGGMKIFVQDLWIPGMGLDFLRADVPVEIGLKNIHIVGVPLAGTAPAGLWNVTFILEDCLLELWSDSSVPNQLALLEERQRPDGFPAADGAQVTEPLTSGLCQRTFDMFDCPDTFDFMLLVDVAFDWTETGTEPPTGQEDLAPGVFSAVNTPAAVSVVEIVTGSDTASLVEALRTAGPARLRVVVINDALQISEDDIDCSGNVIVPQADIVFFGAAATVPPVDLLDFNFASSCIVLQEGVTATLVNLLLNNTRSREEPRLQPLVPFFDAQRDSRVELQNVVWNVMSDGGSPLTALDILEDLQGHPVPEGESDERLMEIKNEGYCSKEFIGNSSSCAESTQCSNLSACPDGAVAVDSVAYRFEGTDYKIVSSLLITRTVGNDTVQADTPAPTPAIAPAPSPASETGNATTPAAAPAPASATGDVQASSASPATTNGTSPNVTTPVDGPGAAPGPAPGAPAPTNVTTPVDGTGAAPGPEPGAPAPTNVTTPVDGTGAAPGPEPGAPAPTNVTTPVDGTGAALGPGAAPSPTNVTTPADEPGAAPSSEPAARPANGTIPVNGSGATGGPEAAPSLTNGTTPIDEPVAAPSPESARSPTTGTAPGDRTGAAASPGPAPMSANGTTQDPNAAAAPANEIEGITEPPVVSASTNGTGPVNGTGGMQDTDGMSGTANETAPAIPANLSAPAAPADGTEEIEDQDSASAPANGTGPANEIGTVPDPDAALAPTNETVSSPSNDTDVEPSPGTGPMPANGTDGNATAVAPGPAVAAGPDVGSSQINGASSSQPGSDGIAASDNGSEALNATQGNSNRTVTNRPTASVDPGVVGGTGNGEMGDSGGGSGGAPSGALIGGVAAVVAVLACVVLIVYSVRRHRRGRGGEKLIDPQGYRVPEAQHTVMVRRNTPPQPTFTKFVAVDDDQNKLVINMDTGEEGAFEDEGMSSSSDESPEDALSHQEAASKLFDNIVMGELLGQGAYGRVYKGTWNGAVVAVKVFTHTVEDDRLEASIEREIHFMTELRHPNVVQQYKAGTRHVTPKSPAKQSSSEVDTQTGSSSGGVHSATYETAMQAIKHSRKATKETWMVMEYCDLGILSNAIKAGWFYRDDGRRELNMECVVRTAQDIARGCEYLHENRTVHGDLKPHNILLATSAFDNRRWCAKLADFGVSRRMGAVSHIYTSTVGTMAYLSPEILRDGKLSEGADVYAYGMIMWQLVCGESVFKQKSAADVWRLIAVEKWRPTFPRSINARYQHLARRCWAEEVQDRPSFQQVQRELGTILQSL
eukprot:evm.model.scf_463.4 EVM.evm.TU.scf_463.4   scf_463:59026-71386(-)